MRLAALLLALVLVVPVAGAAQSASAGADPFAVEAMVDDIERYVAIGPDHHRTGTPEGLRASAWFARELTDAGLDVEPQPFTYLGFHPRQVELRIVGEAMPGATALLYSGVTGPQGVSGELVDVGLGTSFELAAANPEGKIAIIEAPTLQRSVTVTMERIYAGLVDAGAAGVVIVTEGPGDDPVLQNMDSSAGVHGVPAVIVGKHTGARVRGAAGQAAELVLRARVDDSCVGNVVALLPGASDRIVVIATPLQAHTGAASERGPGLAGMLAMARHYAALPQADRPVTLVFAGIEGHEVGMLGLPLLMEAEWFEQVEAFVHLGASLAVRTAFEVGGETVIAPVPEATRVLSISENPLLEPVTPFFAEAQLATSVPPAVAMPGGANHVYAAGVPIVSVAGASIVYHTPSDTIEWVDTDLLEPIVTAFRRTVDHLAALPAGAAPTANALAEITGSSGGSYATNPLAPQPEDPEHAPTAGCGAPVEDARDDWPYEW